ncbi:hypothetical protein [Janthinobacterium sp.]|uniref:hypothetical protein n=1 Tax=Janthinobacterium sp. TaxID=1871054 RepID=UPI00258E3559|nr:hypothetical protein [Janthinobacterium sp.]MCX7293666.1 hypothetical protein [Janthinobacterium sp.]
MAAPLPHAAGPAAGRLDGLSEAFVHLADYANVNTNQIFVVKGALDAGALARSIARAVAAIPLLRTCPDTASGVLTPSAAAQGQLLWQRQFDAPCDFADPAFRQLLMDFSHTMRLDWRERAPIQVLLVTGAQGATSCLYVSTHHGVADARSDCLLLQAIMGYYAHEMGAMDAVAKTFPALPFHSLQQIRPAWYSPLGKLRRWLGAALCIGRDLLRVDRGMAVRYRGSRWESTCCRKRWKSASSRLPRPPASPSIPCCRARWRAPLSTAAQTRARSASPAR